MKKRRLIVSAAALLVVAMLAGGWYLTKPGRTDMSAVDSGKVRFEYGGANILEDLSAEDLDAIKGMFDDKKLYRDNPSCGFGESVAVLLNDGSQTLCVARDACPVVYDKSADAYFALSDEENAQLRGILEKYGFRFPCL